jgi:hypothetical protein
MRQVAVWAEHMLAREVSMVRILDRNVKHWQLLIYGLLIGVMVGGAFTMAATPNAQFSGGTIRLSSAAKGDSISISGTSGPDSLKRVIRTAISIPSGRVGDVQASFTATLFPRANPDPYAYCFAYFTLDSQANEDPAFKPGFYQLIGGQHNEMPNAISVAMNGHRKNIGPGSHYVNVYVSSSYNGCELQERALNVVVNYH